LISIDFTNKSPMDQRPKQAATRPCLQNFIIHERKKTGEEEGTRDRVMERQNGIKIQALGEER
jgi:hypothetical protein